MRLSSVEMIALLFAAIAGLASAVQAYVSWETRGEVSRAIVFAERIDACADLIAALRPFAAEAGEEGRARVASGSADGRYSLPAFFYGQSAGTPGFRSAHEPRIDVLRSASAAVSIVLPGDAQARVDYFERALAQEIPEANYMAQAEMIAWLERLDREIAGLTGDCRGFLDRPPASAGGGLAWW